jgi:hypothetical protein
VSDSRIDPTPIEEPEGGDTQSIIEIARQEAAVIEMSAR